MLLILSVVSVQLITKSGIIEKAKLATLKHEIAKYDEELKLYIVAHREEVNKSPINTSGYENIKKYIPSFKKKYEDKLKISNNKLVYMNDNVSDAEREIFDNAGIGSDEMTQIYYLDENNKEQVLEINDAEISNTSFTNAGINKTQITKIVFGSSCKNIKYEAFGWCTSIKKLEIPNAGNINFANNSFVGCTGLEEVILGEVGKPVKKLNSEMFYGCNQNNLTIKVYVEDEVTSLAGAPWGATKATIEYYSAKTGELVNLIIGNKYQGNQEIDWTEIPNADKITKINPSAFKDCYNLALTSLPSKITKIENNAFTSCKNLKIDKIPEEITQIGYEAFGWCTSIKRLEIPNAGNTNFANSSFVVCKGLEEVILGKVGKPVKKLNSQMFDGCNQNNLTIKVYVEDEVTSLAGAPWGATKATIEYYSAKTGELVNLIIGNKYQGNQEIDWTEIPNADKITKINPSAFKDCYNLALTSLPSKITKIENNAFTSCKNLKIDKIPEEITQIGYEAFGWCTSIKRLEIPNAGNTNFANSSFVVCKGLEEVILGKVGKPVKKLNSQMFDGCNQNNLTIKVYVEGEVTSLAGAPWGATKAIIEYYSATTGEKIK